MVALSDCSRRRLQWIYIHPFQYPRARYAQGVERWVAASDRQLHPRLKKNSMRTSVLLCCCLFWACQSSWAADRTYLPLTIVSEYSEFVRYLTYPEDFVPTEDDPVEGHIVGYVFGVTLGFRVEDDDFWQDPRFCIYVRKPDYQVQRIEIDTTMMWSECEICLEVDFTVAVASPGWLGCYCFPANYVIAEPSLEQLNRTDVRRDVYLR